MSLLRLVVQRRDEAAKADSRLPTPLTALVGGCEMFPGSWGVPNVSMPCSLTPSPACGKASDPKRVAFRG